MSALAFLGGCQPKEKEVAREVHSISEVIMEEVPEAAFLKSGEYSNSDVVELKVTDDGENWFWRDEFVEDGLAGLENFFDARDQERPLVLRVWCRPEIEFRRVRKLIKEALRAGVSYVHLVAKNDKGRFGVLMVDVPMMGVRSEFYLISFLVDEEGEISMKNESGELEKLETVEALGHRLLMQRKAAQMMGSQSMVSVYVNDAIIYGDFIEIFSEFRESIDLIYLMDLNDETNPKDPWWPPEKLPMLPGRPRY